MEMDILPESLYLQLPHSPGAPQRLTVMAVVLGSTRGLSPSTQEAWWLLPGLLQDLV